MRRSYSLIVLSLSFSLFIYLFYRTEKTLVNEIIIFIFSFDTYTEIRNSITNTLPLNETTIFSLPGGFWVFCTTILSRDFYLKISRHEIQIVIVPILFAVGLELFQLLRIINGRFDFRDIGFYFLFWLLAFFAPLQARGPQQNLLSPFTLHSFICVVCFLLVYLAHVCR